MNGGRRLISVTIGIAFVSALGSARPVMANEEAKPAATCPICTKANDEKVDYASKAGSTLARGTTNTLLGWTELIRQPVVEVKNGGNVLVGLANGVNQGVRRTVSGAAEILTFWTPKVHGSYLHFANDCPVCTGKTKTK